MERALWAKKNRLENIPVWLPLTVHLHDTMEVCVYLFDHWLSDGVKDFLTDALESDTYDKEELLRNLCKFLGAVHDLGKATAIFQMRPSFDGDAELDRMMLEHLKNAGFQGVDDYDAAKRMNIRHEVSGQYFLTEFGVPFCVANIIGAHHGKPVSEDGFEDCRSYASSLYQVDDVRSETSRTWQDVQKHIFDWAMEACDFSSVRDLPVLSQPGQVILSGLLIMADWISSNERYFPLIDVDTYEVEEERGQIGFTKWWEERVASWKPQVYSEAMYHGRFPFIKSPRDAQRKISEEIHKIEDPGIMILEAPMGMGKTETALIAVEDLAKKTNRTGMFFGLPTQATSNGIFSRVSDWLGHTEGGKSIRLIHGKAQLNEAFSKLPKSRNIHGEDGVGVNEWFAGRKVSILDDFTVGTVDQILLAALRQKHLMLRHLGFANKVVVIDEVHAYDAYMSVYLRRALWWLGAYGVPVILLSATLPIAKRNALLSAYLIGRGYKCRKALQTEAFETNEAYPLLTYHDGETIKQFSDFEKERGVDYEIIRKAKDESEDIVGIIEGFTKRCGIVGVIVNTVKKAQSFAKQCVDAYGEENVELLHSSFIATDRYEKEQKLIEMIGKEDESDDVVGKKKKRPDFKIIIGTQVIEQSLDIDFDLLITDLAPMDLILQRMGRLHRHQKTKRPEHLRSPKVCVINCKDFDFDKGSAYVYSAYILFRTEYYLPEIINLPNDISHLVQLVYKESEEGWDLKPEDQKTYESYKTDWKDMNLIQEAKANEYLLNRPLLKNRSSHRNNLSDWLKYTDKAAESSEIKAFAQVRDSSDTIEVIALQTCEDGYAFLDKPGKLNPRDNKTAMEVAKRTIKLPNAMYYSDEGYVMDKVIETLEKFYLEHFRDWNEQSWLKNSLAILFDENGEFLLLDKKLKYDKKYGLIVEKEDQNEHIQPN